MGVKNLEEGPRERKGKKICRKEPIGSIGRKGPEEGPSRKGAK
jgi:hypothetical protein